MAQTVDNSTDFDKSPAPGDQHHDFASGPLGASHWCRLSPMTLQRLWRLIQQLPAAYGAAEADDAEDCAQA